MNGYSALDRLLHRVALGFSLVRQTSHDLETLLHRPDAETARQGRHVFIAGLARAGTTILLRSLHESRAFGSLVYSDMPFPLAPNLWARLSKGRRAPFEARQRAHGDGVLVDLDSPEALEEVYWRHFHGREYIRADRLMAHDIPVPDRERFRAYVALILLRRGATRYLSKNNNNVLRLPSLLQTFPRATALTPFRAPLQQARSLLRQHRLFLERHAADPFSASYMRWLAHHEFGSDLRPFHWERGAWRDYKPHRVDHWLAQWIDAYGALLERVPEQEERVLFLPYERLCADTRQVWTALARRLDFPAEPVPNLRLRELHPEDPANMPSPDLLDQANELHERLIERFRRKIALAWAL